MTRRQPAVVVPIKPRSTKDDELLEMPEILAALKVPKSTFYRWKALGIAPATIKYPNGGLRAWRSVIDAWIADQERAAA